MTTSFGKLRHHVAMRSVDVDSDAPQKIVVAVLYRISITDLNFELWGQSSHASPLLTLILCRAIAIFATHYIKSRLRLYLASDIMAKSEEATPLYNPISSRDEDSDFSTCDAEGFRVASVWRRRFYYLLAISLSVFLVLSSTLWHFSGLARCTNGMAGVTMPYTPAPVRYVNKDPATDFNSHQFIGDPRPELDEAWHALLSGTGIRLSEEEIKRANATNVVRHKDGGYVGGLGISHLLHCLKRIKQFLHPEYYYPEGGADWNWDDIRQHVDHCLESLRTEVLCHADPSVYTFVWTPQNRVKPAVQVSQKAACVDWTLMHQWMEERATLADDIVKPPDSFFDVEVDG
ncbi:hypothetical protein F4778DRAFT_785296 [Xylariomycetidae sp. FL2044]|nr:hypothetical protein F4778DRAFT_785296 [Xylariomycetidae sp. FL2044]